MTNRKIEIEPKLCSRLLTTHPVVVITTVDERGRVNAASFGSYMAVSPYVLCAIWPESHTYLNIQETEEFVINVPGRDRLESIMIVAREYPKGVNELVEAGLTAIPALKVKPPRVEEYKAHVECRHMRSQDIAGHMVVMGEMIAGSCDADLVDDDMRFDVVKAGVVHICRYPEPVYISSDRKGYVRGKATMDMPGEEKK